MLKNDVQGCGNPRNLRLFCFFCCFLGFFFVHQLCHSFGTFFVGIETIRKVDLGESNENCVKPQVGGLLKKQSRWWDFKLPTINYLSDVQYQWLYILILRKLYMRCVIDHLQWIMVTAFKSRLCLCCACETVTFQAASRYDQDDTTE